MLVTLVAVAALFGTPIALISVALEVRRARRESRDLQDKKQQQAVTTATTPLKEALMTMTSDRNYWRDRADAFETELRRREGNS